MRYPVTRQGWFDFYARQNARTGSTQAEHLALWFFLLDLAEPQS